VLIVSMQVGDAEAPVTMTRRSEQITARIPETPGKRNPHMRGVTRALQLLHGMGLENEYLGDGSHVLRAYAMANSVLCSALPTGGKSRRGRPTDVMLGNCAPHLSDTLDVLDPTVVHTQGADTRVAVERLVRMVDRHSEEVSTVEFRGRRMVPAMALARELALELAGPPD
jgi:hypothetical protein